MSLRCVNVAARKMMRFIVILAILVFASTFASPTSVFERNANKDGKKDEFFFGEIISAFENNGGKAKSGDDVKFKTTRTFEQARVTIDVVQNLYKIGGPVVAALVLMLIEVWILIRCLKARRSKKKEADVEGKLPFNTKAPQRHRSEIQIKSEICPSKQKKKEMSRRKCMSTAVHYQKKKPPSNGPGTISDNRSRSSGSPRGKPYNNRSKLASVKTEPSNNSVSGPIDSVKKTKRKSSKITSGSTSFKNLKAKTGVKRDKDSSKIMVDKEKKQLITNIKILKMLHSTETEFKRIKAQLSVLNEKAKKEEKPEKWRATDKAASSLHRAFLSSCRPAITHSGYRKRPLLTQPAPTSRFHSWREFVGVKQAFRQSSLGFKEAIMQRQMNSYSTLR